MKIYLTPSTAGRYGGWLNGTLRHFDRFIQSELDKSGFACSFGELWLTLSYPPLYVLPGVVGMEVGFRNGYDKLPYSRLNRRYKKIDIALQAPEFSEHFDKEKRDSYLNQFEIEEQFKNISETELASKLIDKYLEAGELIVSKLKKEDIFGFEAFKTTLLSIKKKISPEFLLSTSLHGEEKRNESTLHTAIELREKRKLSRKPLNKPIRDLRIYYHGIPNKALYPYDFQYTEIFMNLLQRNGLMCPTYHHLYIQIVPSLEEGLKNSYAIEDWYVNGISVLSSYENLTEAEKESAAFDCIVNGLKDIVEIDNLDNSIIDRTVDEIKIKGLDTELLYNTIENKAHTLTISYLSRSAEEECPIFFRLTEKETGRSNKFQIGSASQLQIHLWLQKITLTRSLIKIKSSITSVRADVWLKDKPRSMEFAMEDILSF